jgi:pimeloyl-ACP methyl ester carboxylesterase
LRVGSGRVEYEWHHGAVDARPEGDRGPALVFLHEGLGCRALWRGFPQHVARATGLDAFVYSRPGYGASDPIGPAVSQRYMHDEALNVLPKVLRAAAIAEHILVGHSDGASISIIYAGGNAGDGLRGLVLLAPHVFVEPLNLRSIAKARDAFERGDLASRLKRWHGANTTYAFSRWNDSWLAPEFARWNIEEYLPRIRVPILVIQGQSDEYGSNAQIEAIERQAGGKVRSVLLPECGHSPQLDQPQATLNEIVSFVKSLA